MRKLDQAVWLGWRHRAETEKGYARKTDADLAAEISELVGYDVGRATVNHWFRGRREPSVPEFIALCTALGADPGAILLNVRSGFQRVPEGSTVAQVLQERAPSPPYLAKSAKRLKRTKKPVPGQRAKVRA